jgi:hypothetical protein
MLEAPDYDLIRGPGDAPDPPPPKRPLGLWITAAGLVAAAAIAAYIAFGGRMTSAPATTKADGATPPRAVQPLGSNAAPIDLPPLDQTDPLVRSLVTQIASHPRIAAWLATDGLIRNFVVVTSNVAEGKTPAAQLRVLRPSAGFRVDEKGAEFYIDPRSYERYDGLAAAAAAIDPAGAASLYATLKPRIEEAHKELGLGDYSFDRTLERAIVLLLGTPVADDPVRTKPHGGTRYDFADSDLESLSPAQKQLLRTGPRNVRSIQASFRAIALALGIPAERLPLTPFR